MNGFFVFGLQSPAVLIVPLIGLVLAGVLLRGKARYVNGSIESAAPSIDDEIDAMRPIEQQRQAEDAAFTALVFYCSLLEKDLKEWEQKRNQGTKEAEKLAIKAKATMQAVEYHWAALGCSSAAHYTRDETEPFSWNSLREADTYVKALPSQVNEALHSLDPRDNANTKPAHETLRKFRHALTGLRDELGGGAAASSSSLPAPSPEVVKGWTA
jgi:hypothetical protein